MMTTLEGVNRRLGQILTFDQFRCGIPEWLNCVILNIDYTAYLKYNIFTLLDAMTETIELDNFDISFSFRCPKCDYQNEEISANDLTSGNAECGMCETIFKLEGIDAIKITAILE